MSGSCGSKDLNFGEESYGGGKIKRALSRHVWLANGTKASAPAGGGDHFTPISMKLWPE